MWRWISASAIWDFSYFSLSDEICISIWDFLYRQRKKLYNNNTERHQTFCSCQDEKSSLTLAYQVSEDTTREPESRRPSWNGEMKCRKEERMTQRWRCSFTLRSGRSDERYAFSWLGGSKGEVTTWCKFCRGQPSEEHNSCCSCEGSWSSRQSLLCRLQLRRTISQSF